ncbi:MAG: FixH family protein [Myxococcales bacterium]|nr:FixH family protein [Myxococcales bacterium]
MNDTNAGEPASRNLAWPVGIVVGLGFVVVANAIMIGVAVSHPSAPAAGDHWAESLAWDQELELRERSAALGWSIAELGGDARGLTLRLLDDRGRPLTGLRGELRLERADSTSHDARLSLIDLGEGRYRSEPAPISGLVHVALDVQDPAGNRFVAQRSIEIDAQEQP